MTASSVSVSLRSALACILVIGGLALLAGSVTPDTAAASTTAAATAATASTTAAATAATASTTAHEPATAEATSAAAANDWTALKNPAPTDAILISSTCVDAWDCWSVGGVFATGRLQGSFTGVAERWDGSSWSSVPTQSPNGIGWIFTSVTCDSANDCWAVGGEPHNGAGASPIAERWDGRGWSIVPMTAVDGYLLGVSCASASACWAVGSRTDGNGDSRGILLERWDGSSWSLASAPATGQVYSSLNSVSCSGPSECFGVGWDGPNPQDTNFLPIFPAEADGKNLIERWDGSEWSIVPSPQFANGSYLSGVTCVSPDDCFAVGSLTNIAGNPSAPLIENWSGTTWTSSPTSGIRGSYGDFLHEVACTDPSDCVAVGEQGLENGFKLGIEPSSAEWNGSAWSGVPAPGSPPAAFLDGVACAGGAKCLASGLVIRPAENGIGITSILEQLDLPQGYSLAGSNGGAYNFGADTFHGSMSGKRLAAPIVGIAAFDAGGYRLVGSDGGVFAFGDATYDGSMGRKRLNAPIEGIASEPDRNGYWLVGSDGGVFSFGDASFYGSMGGKRLNAPVAGIASTPDGDGYWLVGSDGGVFCFGDAPYRGSMSGRRLVAPVAGIAPTPDGNGYWLVASDGGVFAFGDASFYGSMGGRRLNAPMAGIASAPDGNGYWLVGSDGGVFSFGGAAFLGSEAGKGIDLPVVGAA